MRKRAWRLGAVVLMFGGAGCAPRLVDFCKSIPGAVLHGALDGAQSEEAPDEPWRLEQRRERRDAFD